MTRLLSRHAVSLATLFALACGGADKTVTPPPPQLKLAIGSMVLTETRAILYLGQPAAIADIVAHVYDVRGTEVAKSDLHFTADVPSDWSVRNDSIFPPSTEQRYAVTIHASYKDKFLSSSVAAKVGAFLPLFDVVSDSAPVVSTDVVTDLSLRRWKYSSVCGTPPGQPQQFMDTNGPFYVDSIVVVNAAIDSVQRNSMGSALWGYPIVPAVTGLYYSYRATEYRHDGSTMILIGSGPDEVLIAGQAPDTAFVQFGALVRTSLPGQPLRYDSANYPASTAYNLCNWGIGGPASLQEF